MTATLKTGARVRCRYAFGDITRTGRVVRVHRDDALAGFVPVKFDDAPDHRGMMVHRSQVDIIDNRPGYGVQ